MLVLVYLMHFAAVLTDALFLDGLVSGLLISAAVAAFSSRSARSGDRPG